MTIGTPFKGSTDNRNWRIFRDRRGSPRWFQRFYEAMLIVSGKHSLHRAWQLGYDMHCAQSMAGAIANVVGGTTPISRVEFDSFRQKPANPHKL